MRKLASPTMGLVAATLCVLTWIRWHQVGQEDATAVFQVPALRGDVANWRRMLDTTRAHELIVSRNIFRTDRAPAAHRGERADHASSSQSRSTNTRPALVVKAIAGPPWRAIIDGLPGERRDVVTEAGAVFDRLTIRSITRDAVVVRGPDTTWVLAVRQP